MAVKVSVVVPVYNPGSSIDRCIDSLLGQTMSPAELEIIFVDDGSTDETPARLDQLAAEHENVSVIHIPNSGWPGKPRNIGVEAARGEYVQYVDQDDFMAPDALRRLYDLGHRNGADIVIGKVVSNWRGVPAGVWKTTRDKVTIRDFPLWDSLTPHKMFRRAFLEEEKIRFPEGKRRLEDQLYMMQAYFPAKVVSILGDYTCYYYWRRADKKNAGSTPIEPVGYYDNLREVLQVVIDNTEPGEFRDRILRRFYRVEMLGRLSDAALLRYAPDYRAAIFEEIRKLTAERMTESVTAPLPALMRMKTTLLRAGRLDTMVELAERCHDVKARTRVDKVSWSDGQLKVGFTAGLERGADGTPLTLLQQDDTYFLDPQLADGLLDWRDGRIDDERRGIRAEVTVRDREAATEWSVPAKVQVCFDDAPPAEGAVPAHQAEGRRIQVSIRGVATLDPERLAGGRPLDKGIWDIWVRVIGLGFDQRTRPHTRNVAGFAGQCVPAVLGKRASLVVPYFTDGHDNLSLDVDRRSKSVAAAVEGRPFTPLASSGTALAFAAPVVRPVGSPAVPAEAVLREAGASALDSTSVVVPARLTPGSPRAHLVVDLSDASLTHGRWRLFARLDGDDVPEVPVGYVVVDARGRVAVEGAPRTTAFGRLAHRTRRVLATRPAARRAVRRIVGHLPGRWRDQLRRSAQRAAARNALR